MPYRRLPTTDKARIRALEAALEKVIGSSVTDIPFSSHSVEDLQNVATTFKNTLTQYELNIKQQSEYNNKTYKVAQETARMYLGHFIQVLLFANDRGEINGGIKFYGDLKKHKGKVPQLNTEKEILEWGQIVVEGEQKRIMNGGSAIYSPSIALVKFKLQEFSDAAIFLQNLKRNTLRTFEQMQQLRKSTNQFLADIWTEIELTMEELPPEERREKAEEYGIVYVLRRNERKMIEAAKKKQQEEMERHPKELELHFN